MSDSSSPKDFPGHEESPKIDKKIKNFSAALRARAKADAKAAERAAASTPNSRQDATPRPDSVASTVRPDSVLSFRSEIPNVSMLWSSILTVQFSNVECMSDHYSLFSIKVVHLCFVKSGPVALIKYVIFNLNLI